jgi:hypothetical protein
MRHSRPFGLILNGAPSRRLPLVHGDEALIRWEYHAHNFLGFVQLACLVIPFKRF